jgi:proliferating cell nuclear antigen
MSNISQSPDCVLEIKTVQIAPFKTLITALKDILLETNIIFQKDGIKIINMDKTHTILAHLHLKAEQFEEFFCKYPKIVIGVNMQQLFKLINSIDTNDTLTIYIDKDHYDDGIVKYLGLKFENGDIRQCKTQLLKVIDPAPEENDVMEKSYSYSTVITMPSSDFQKIIRDMSALSDKMEIKCVMDEIIFSLVGPFAKVKIRRQEGSDDNNIKFPKKIVDHSIVKEEFNLKFLSYFIKCTNLCNNIELMIENDKPLVVEYQVASLGTIKLCLSPISKNNDL